MMDIEIELCKQGNISFFRFLIQVIKYIDKLWFLKTLWLHIFIRGDKKDEKQFSLIDKK